MDLFSFQATYPHHPGFKRRITAAEAAEAIAPRAQGLREQVESVIRDRRGATADECALALDLSILTIRPRVSELAKMNRIKDSGQRRENVSGRSAIVWVVPDAFDAWMAPFGECSA